MWDGTSRIVYLNLLEAIARVGECTRTPEQRLVLQRHAEMVHQSGQTHATEAWDRIVIDQHYEATRAALGCDDCDGSTAMG